AWAALGPMLEPPPGSGGLLHHLLAGCRLPAVPPAGPLPLERLLALARPRGSTLRVQVQPEFDDGLSARPDLKGQPSRLPRPFQLQDTVRFAFQTDRDCTVALLDIGAAGTV